MTTKHPLGEFEGHPVTRSSVEIPGAAGGLREAMKVEPVKLAQGTRVYVLLECDVAKIRHDPLDKGELAGAQNRVHVLDALAGTLLDPKVAKPVIEAQKAKIIEAREAAAGIERLPGVKAEDEADAAGVGAVVHDFPTGAKKPPAKAAAKKAPAAKKAAPKAPAGG